jgi:hypothetical protein
LTYHTLVPNVKSRLPHLKDWISERLGTARWAVYRGQPPRYHNYERIVGDEEYKALCVSYQRIGGVIEH